MTFSMKLARWLSAVVAVIGVVTLAPSPAVPASKGCGRSGYAYAGLQSDREAFGVTATLSALADPLVERGHVAAWVGVGAPDEGPEGTNEWLQVGLNRIAGRQAKLYYEVARSGRIRYVELNADVSAGRRVDVAVLEMAGRQDVWRVWVDGRPASKPIYLPRSHSRLTPMAIAENWDGGVPACNRYKYRFRSVSLAERPGGAWTPLRRTQAQVMQDAGYRILPSPTDGFVAVTAPPPPQTAKPQPQPQSTPAPPRPQSKPSSPATTPVPVVPAPGPATADPADGSDTGSHGLAP
jgi:hypothetical protein